jgi:hypothetical protein
MSDIYAAILTLTFNNIFNLFNFLFCLIAKAYKRLKAK